MKNFLQNPKFKNPIFWTSFVAIIFASAGVDFNDLTSWSLLGSALLGIFNNPVSIMAVVVACIGVFNDNGTKGIDKLSTKCNDSCK